MKENSDDVLVTSEQACVGALVEEYKQAGVMPNGCYDVAFNQEVRRMIWAGQSADGRKWDENMPEGSPALPWNGSSDTRVPMVDGLINIDVATGCVAFRRAELRASAVDPDRADLASEVSKHLHWMVHTRHKQMLALEVELSLQYSREHGFCMAYVGWEREVCKRRVKVSLEDLMQAGGQQSASERVSESVSGEDQGLAGDRPSEAGPTLLQLIMDPEMEEGAVVMMQEVYRQYVTMELQGKGFFEEELEDDKLVTLKVASARRAVRELREDGSTEIPVPYVSRNQPVVWVGQPYVEMLAARGTMELEKSRAIFWRRWMTEAEIRSKEAAEGWDGDWIEEVIKTKGNISAWDGSVTGTGPSTKTVGGATYTKVTEDSNPLIEVVYAHRKVVDEDGVMGIWETIFSPHLTGGPNAGNSKLQTPNSKDEWCAKHELVDDTLGRYAFVAMKRENLGRALTDTRSVSEIAGTWQNEEKEQRDMLFNRSQWDTLPPVRVPKLGGVDYRLGPGAQIPLNKNQDIEALNLKASSPELAIELVNLIRLRAKEYFGNPDPTLDPALTAAQMEKRMLDLYNFWGEILLRMFALTAHYNPGEVDRVCGRPGLARSLDVMSILDELDFSLEFDVQELNPEYLLKKMKMLNELVLPADAAGVIDRAGLTAAQMGMLDPKLKQRLVQDQATAAQKIYDEVDREVGRMALGNEAKYVENDPTAGMRLEYLKTVVMNNPKYQLWLAPGKGDQRFQLLMENYVKNLQMSVEQQQNKVVGRIGVKQIGAGVGG